tara:strand:- start:1557 stop:2009 length:453 start_codon:yes stop_codon:yes gene_type:complete
MVTFRNNNNSNRRNSFRRNTRNFKSNGDNSKFGSNFSNGDNFKRKAPGRNNHNAPKLIEKYNDLAREALSNGDKILSENYLQHADHFTRILNERENFRKDKISETKSENSSNIVDQNIENSEHNSDKGLSETPKDEIETQNNLKSQVEIN